MKKTSVKASQPNTAKKKDIILFVIACITLVFLIVFLCLPTGMDYFNPDNDDYELENPQIPGAEVVAVFAFGVVYLFIGIILTVGVISCLIFGFFISAVLAIKKSDRPRWMRISSLVLMLIYLLFIISLVVIWII